MRDSQRQSVEEMLHNTSPETALIMAAPGGELLAASDSSGALAIPVNVIPPARAERLERLVQRALLNEVKDADSYRIASDGLKNLELEISAQDDYVTELRRPFNEVMQKISAESKAGLLLPRRGVVEWKNKIKAFLIEQEAERQRQIESQRKAQQEAERKQREIDEARQREEERLRAEAEGKRIEAERLAWQVEEAERVAIAEMEAAGATAQARAKLAEQLAQQAEQNRIAEQARIEADQKQRELETQQAQVVHVVESEVVHVAAPIEIKRGAKFKMVPILDSINMAALPTEFCLADEKKIIKALEMGLPVAGVKHHLEPNLKSRRGSLK